MTTGQKLWDTQKYRNHYDSEEVWQLKEAFMMKHRATIPEEDLVFLTQTLVNIEVLKCRYSVALMKRVESLAGNILTDFRKKRGNRLKRTFVSASTAAMCRVTRTAGVPPERAEQTLPVPSSISCPLAAPSSSTSETIVLEDDDPVDTGINRKKKRKPKKMSDRLQPHAVSTTVSNKIRKDDPFLNEFGRILLYDDGPTTPRTIVQKVAGMCSIPLMEYQIIQGDEWKVDIELGGKIVATATGGLQSKEEVKISAYDKALEELQQRYYTLKLKLRYVSKEVIMPKKEKNRKKSNKNTEKTNVFQDHKLGESNLGFRLLKSLGWAGGGLGQPESSSQAIVEPIGISINCGRQGIGCQVTKEVTFSRYIQGILKNFASSNEFYDLQFDTSVTKEQREEIHKATIRYNLKTKSRNVKNGSGKKLRELIVSKNLNIFEIANILLSTNPDPVLAQKYELIPPKSKSTVIELD